MIRPSATANLNPAAAPALSPSAVAVRRFVLRTGARPHQFPTDLQTIAHHPHHRHHHRYDVPTPLYSVQRRPRPVVSTTPRVMLQHSLALALEEADASISGFHNDQLLRRANVSPFFSSSNAPTIPTTTPHSSRDGNVDVAAPLHLEPPSNAFGETSIRGGLSRVSSWCDFSLDSEPLDKTQRLESADATPSEDGESPPNAWHLFLEGKAPHGGPIIYALKTPTAVQSMPTFPCFEEPPVMGGHLHYDPTAFSPTHMDKKVLVTDSDLKLEPTASSCCWEEPNAECRGSLRARSSREKLFPQHHGGDDLTRPRRALLHDRPNRPHRMTTSPYAGVSPRDLRYTGEPRNVYSAPLASPRSAIHAVAPCVFPLVDQHWKRSAAASPCHDEMHDHRHDGGSVARRGRSVDAFSPRVYAASSFHNGLSHHNRSMATHATERAPLRPPSTKTRKTSKRKIGIYSPEARRERIRRFHEKRKQRVFHKRIKYDCRKRLANACPREKGRFVRKQVLVSVSETQPSDDGSADLCDAVPLGEA